MIHTIGIDIGSGAVKTVLFRTDGATQEWLAKRCDQFIVNDLDHLLTRVQRFGYFCANGALANFRDKGFDHAKMHIRFEQREAHFAHGSIHVRFREFTSAAEAVKDLVKSSSESFKHKFFIMSF